jgi:Uri superfamily endonuclease
MTVADLAFLRPWPGTYALVCESSGEAEVPVGRLGTLSIQVGFYVYVGSALGAGGIRARVGHHIGQGVRRHWHVDYLWPTIRIGEIWYCYDPVRREHEWARILYHLVGCTVPLRGFGASDCRCESHLLFSEHVPSLGSFQSLVRASLSGHGRVRRIRAGSREDPRHAAWGPGAR